MWALLFLIPFAQDVGDPSPLIRDLEDDNPEVRAGATAKLRVLGPRVLPALKASTSPHARDLAARFEWEPVVPLWAEVEDPGLFGRLAGGDPSAYDLAVRHGCLRLFLDRKVVAEGSWAQKKRVLAGIASARRNDAVIDLVLDALLVWDHAAAPLEDRLFDALLRVLVQSVGADQKERLQRLSRHPEPRTKAAATLGLAAIGDPDAAATAIRWIEDPSSPRRLAALEALGRAPDPRCAPVLKQILQRGNSTTIVATLETLDAYPALDIRAELVGLLTHSGGEDHVNDAVRAGALRHMAARKLDETRRIWDLASEGRLKSSDQMRLGERLTSLERALGAALLVADDPVCLDWLDELERVDRGAHVGMLDALYGQQPPRLDAYLRDVAAGRRTAPDIHAKVARDYVSRGSRSKEAIPPEKTLAVLERSKAPEELREAFHAVEHAGPGTTRDRLAGLAGEWVEQKDHPLRTGAARLLRRLGRSEGTDALLEIASREGPDRDTALWALQGEERARPLLLEKLKRDSESERWNTMHLLARMREPSVPPLVLQAFRERKYLVFGDALASYLRPYEDHDFTPDLVALIQDDTPDAHLQQILSYIGSKDRKDQVPLFRRYIGHRSHEVRSPAISALGRWRDAGSYGLIEESMKTAGGSNLWTPLGALATIDPARARGLLLSLLRQPPSDARAPVLSAFAHLAGPEDHALLVRLVMTEPNQEYIVLQAAARRRIPEALEPILALAGAGAWRARLTLSYFGDRRAVPLLACGLDANGWHDVVQALDYVVHYERYPDLGAKRPLGPAISHLPFADAARKAKDAFGLRLAHSPALDPPWLSFSGEKDLVEWLEWECTGAYVNGRFAHLWRDGRVELLPFDEARAYWKEWWARHASEYR